MDIVVINSFGPMGSSVVASVVEKLGWLNIPVRKIGLHDYLLGNRQMDDPYMFNRFVANINKHHEISQQSGGVNVLDRDSSIPKQIVNKDLILDELEQIKSIQFERVEELYHHLRSVYAKAVVYKKIGTVSDKHIEYTTDLSSFDPKELMSAYQNHFDKTYMIHLHRDFVDLMNSFASQSFSTKSYKRKFKPVLIGRRYKSYVKYESAINAIPGLHLNFKDLFLPNTKRTIETIANYLNCKLPTIRWEQENFDLYGKLCSYEKTFTAVDDNINYLSSITKNLISSAVDKKIPLRHSVLISLCYLLDSVRFQLSQQA